MEMENKHLDEVYLFYHPARSPICLDIQITHLSLAVWQTAANLPTFNNTHLLTNSSEGQKTGGLGWILFSGSHKAKVKVSAGRALIWRPWGGICSQVHSDCWMNTAPCWLSAQAALRLQRRPTLLLTGPFHLRAINSTRNPGVVTLCDFLFCH